MKISVSKQNHRNESRLKLEFEYNKTIIGLVKQIEGAGWSRTMKAWHVPDTEEKLRQLKVMLAEHELVLAGELESPNLLKPKPCPSKMHLSKMLA